MEFTTYRQYLLNEFPANTTSTIEHVDYILGIATEEYDNILNQRTGKFIWENIANGLSPEKVREIKRKYMNVRIILSIGGIFQPMRKDKWIPNALQSIKHIMVDRYYNLFDGIDINYDFIKTSEEDFTSYIGDFVSQLKVLVPKIQEVSIAPSRHNNSFYHQLYSSNQSIISLVGYKYYRGQVDSVNEGVNIFDALNGEYAEAKVLPGLNTPPNIIINELIDTLQTDNKVAGYFVWYAEN